MAARREVEALDEGTAGFLSDIRARAFDLDSEQAARRAAEAVLAEVSTLLSSPAADEIASLLPDLAARPGDAPGNNGDGGDELLARVARREGLVDLATVACHVQAVLRAVEELGQADALAPIRRQLNAELRGLWLTAEASRLTPGVAQAAA
jgi:uncharacterized protein (DUF2267 family)